MSYNERKEMYVKLEKLRNRKLIVYVTSIRPNLSSSMAADAILPLIDQIKNIPENCKEIDFLIISNGGDPITALRMMSILRERFDKITVLIPYVAYSAATILALGADEIIMHPFSNLGPVDPQLTINKKNEIGQNENLHFSSEDLRNYINFVKNDIKIKKPKELVNALESITKEVGVLNIGGAKRSQQLSLELSKKLLKTHMKDKQKVKKIAKSMNLSYYHHGYAVSRKEAHDLGLNIINPEKELEELLWNIWENFKLEMKCDYAFNIIDEIQKYPQINNVPIVNIPANTPIDVARNIIIQKAQQTPITTRVPIQLDFLTAVIESINLAFEVKNKLDILYWRNPDMTLGTNVTIYSKGWNKI